MATIVAPLRELIITDAHFRWNLAAEISTTHISIKFYQHNLSCNFLIQLHRVWSRLMQISMWFGHMLVTERQTCSLGFVQLILMDLK